jgi:hypothetical protein
MIYAGGFKNFLIGDNCLDRAFISGLLNGIFELFRNFIDNNDGHFIAHVENIGTGIDTKPASGAGVLNSYYHSNSPL